jgi:Skp family chaperone for outer membrane proteins
MHALVRNGFFLLGLLFAAPLAAQNMAAGANSVIVIDSERLFLNSDFGKRVAREIEARGTELAAENRRIEAELAQAEKDLTDTRASMTPEGFRPLADAFDTRVQATRQAQAEKSRALNTLLDQEREVFLSTAGPVLQELMLELGASVVLERRNVVFSASNSDITAVAIGRLNIKLGEGADVSPVPVPAQTTPEQTTPEQIAPSQD